MNNQTNKSESSGCFMKTVIVSLSIFLAVFIFANIFIFMPLIERALQKSVCKSGTIRNEGSGKHKKSTCLDKKTGKKTDVSILQVVSCCPGAFILVFVSILWFILTIINIRGGERRNKAQPDFRNFRS